MAITNLNITRRVGDTKPLRITLYAEGSKEPSILTGHTFVFNIEDGTHTPAGSLFAGDCAVYFTIPTAVSDVAGTYAFELEDTDGAGDRITAVTGNLIYE